MHPIWVALIVIVVTCCDAFRDRWTSRQVNWWQWHIVKWIAFYTPLVALTVLFIPWIFWIPLVIVARIVWRAIYLY